MIVNRPTGLARAIIVLLTVAFSFAVHLRAQSNSGEEKREARRLVQPRYSELAKKLNLTGTVKVEVTIGPDGIVKKARVLGGHPVLAMDAEKAAMNSTFQPAAKETTEILEFKFAGSGN
jgi:TonB family protein